MIKRFRGAKVYRLLSHGCDEPVKQEAYFAAERFGFFVFFCGDVLQVFGKNKIIFNL